MAPESADFKSLFRHLVIREVNRRNAQRRSGEAVAQVIDVHRWVAEKSDLSVRSITRLSGQSEFPERATLGRLVKAFPALSAYREGGAPILAGWSIVEAYQSGLERGSTITVLSGWGKPLVMMLDEPLATVMARRVAENVLTHDMKYAFVFPRHAGADDPAPRAHRRILSAATADDFEIKTPRDWAEFPRLIRDSVRFFPAPRGLGWHLLPRYSVFYNLAEEELPSFRSFGMFWERGASGLLPPATSSPLPGEGSAGDNERELDLLIDGWTYFNREDFRLLRKHLISTRLLETDHFPRPSKPMED